MIELELVKNSARRSCTPVSRYLMKITEQEMIAFGLGVEKEKIMRIRKETEG